jgi:TetR/AcrR family transcriptional repressor of mexJK operon
MRAKLHKPGAALALWRSKRSDKKRELILLGAQKVFLSKGFGGATMDAVAEVAGVSKMTVYRHYKSKEALFAGLIQQLCDRIVGDNLTLDLKRPIAEVLREYAERMVEIVFAPGTIGLHRIVVAESTRFPSLGRLFYRSGPEASIAGLAAYLARQQRSKRIMLGDTRRAAEEFLELLRGYTHLRVMLGIDRRPSRRELAARVNAAVDHILRRLDRADLWRATRS